jgi:hypothetical protein
MKPKQYPSFKVFYPFYLSQHAHPWCRRLHFIGTCCVILFFVLMLTSMNFWYLAIMPIAGYFFSWWGHFFIEKNKPATFAYPFYSLAADFLMFKDMLI